MVDEMLVGIAAGVGSVVAVVGGKMGLDKLRNNGNGRMPPVTPGSTAESVQRFLRFQEQLGELQTAVGVLKVHCETLVKRFDEIVSAQQTFADRFEKQTERLHERLNRAHQRQSAIEAKLNDK